MSESNNQLERQQIIETSKSVDAFHKIALQNLDILSDSELNDQFARTTDLEIAATLIRARIFEIKLKRNRESANPKSERQVAIELVESTKCHFRTLIKDSRIADLFKKYNLNLSRDFYESILSLLPQQQSAVLRLANNAKMLGKFDSKSFNQKINDYKLKNKKRGKTTEIIHKITLEITDRELADLNKIKRGFKNVSGFGKGALGYAIRSAEAEMARLKIEGYPDKDWVVRTIIRLAAADMANRQARAGFESKNKKKIEEELN